jgi:hypothetical protein
MSENVESWNVLRTILKIATFIWMKKYHWIPEVVAMPLHSYIVVVNLFCLSPQLSIERSWRSLQFLLYLLAGGAKRKSVLNEGGGGGGDGWLITSYSLLSATSCNKKKYKCGIAFVTCGMSSL